MSTSTFALTSGGNHSRALVVYGLDDGGKPHASLFADADADLAEKAAEMMSMRAFRVTEPEQLTTVAGLPKGRVFSSGRAFVPYAGRAISERLVALGGAPAPKPISRPAAPIARPAKVKAVGAGKLTGLKGEEAEIGAD